MCMPKGFPRRWYDCPVFACVGHAELPKVHDATPTAARVPLLPILRPLTDEKTGPHDSHSRAHRQWCHCLPKEDRGAECVHIAGDTDQSPFRMMSTRL